MVAYDHTDVVNREGSSGYFKIYKVSGVFDLTVGKAKNVSIRKLKDPKHRKVAEVNGLLSSKSLWPIFNFKKKRRHINSFSKALSVSQEVQHSDRGEDSSNLSIWSVPVEYAVECHGQQKEFIDIGRNNSKQWGMLADESG